MPIAAGTTNLFFNRDTKVFLGQSAGKPIVVANTLLAANALTTGVAHGLTTGDRIMFANNVAGLGGAGLPVVGTVYYAISLTTTTFSVAATFALAIAGTALVITGTPTTTPLVHQLDGYLTPATAIITGGTTLTITATHNFSAGDVVDIAGITDTAYLNINGTYVVASISTTVNFTVTLDSATNGTISTPSVIRVTKENLWELPVLQGYAVSQGTSTSEVTLNEMSNASGISRRGKQVFTDSMSPSEWSFDTYMRPFKSTSQYCVEEPLWAAMIGRNYSLVSGSATTQTTVWSNGLTPNTAASYVTRDATDLEFAFTASNSVTLTTFDIYFVLGASKVSGRSYTTTTDGGSTTIYKVSGAVINECAMTFDIDGISTISWSGMGSAVTELGAFYGTLAGSMGQTSTSNFIRNRLTALTAVSTSPTATTYDITLTGGSITISNNITFLTPEVMGIVNKPIGHVTGTRSITGTFTAYLDEISNGTVDLFQNIAERGNSTITNSFALNFFIGGGSGVLPTAPGVQIAMGQCHLEVPNLSFDDVISTEVNFHALPSAVGGADEISVVRYIGQPL